MHCKTTILVNMHLFTVDLFPLDKCITAQNYFKNYVEVQEHTIQIYFHLRFEEILILAKFWLILKLTIAGKKAYFKPFL